jgi:hypothetical protein
MMKKQARRRPWLMRLPSIAAAAAAASAALTLGSAAAEAAIVRHDFSGVVTTLPTSLEATFTLGQAFSGHFAWDDTVAPTAEPLPPNLARYDNIVAFEVHIGRFVFELTTPLLAENTVRLSDNAGGGRAPFDQLTVFVGRGFTASGAPGFDVFGAAADFFDPTAAALSGTALPEGLALSAFGRSLLEIDFMAAGTLGGRVDTLTAGPPTGVGEPATLGLAAAAGLAAVWAARRTRRDPQASKGRAILIPDCLG